MSVTDALSLFGIASLQEIDLVSLNKLYRLKIKKHHPDLFAHDSSMQKANEDMTKLLNEANSVIMDALAKVEKESELSKQEQVFAIIPYQSLIDIFNGKSVDLKSPDNKSIKLDKTNIKSHRIAIKVLLRIESKLGVSNHTFILPVNLNDEYSVFVDYEVEESLLSESIPMDVICNDKRVGINLSNISKVCMNFEYISKLYVTINKRIKK